MTGYNVYRASTGGETSRDPLNGDDELEGTSYGLDGVPTDEKRLYVVESIGNGWAPGSQRTVRPAAG